MTTKATSPKTSKTAVKAPAKAAKAPAKTPAKAPAKTAAKATATRVSPGSAKAEPSLRFHHSKALRTRSDAVLDALEKSPTDPRHGAVLADLVAALVEAGMDYYFLRALQQAKVGFIKEQSARLGVSGAIQLINSVSRKYIVSMDSQQLLVVAAHMRSLA